MWDKLKAWFGPAIDSIKGKINQTELVRVLVTALVTALGTGGLDAALTYLQLHIVDFFPDYGTSTYATLAFIVTAIFEFIRRKYLHGETKVKDQTALK